MDAATLASIDDIETLRRCALEALAQRDQKIDRLEKTVDHREKKIELLTSELRRLRRVQYGVRSEQLTPEQRELFEDSLAADIGAVEAELEALQTGVPKKGDAQPRRRPARRPLPPELPRIEHRHEPASCACEDCGSALSVIGEDVSEQLEYVPAQFVVHRHIRPQYACRACETITAVPAAAAIIDRGLAGPGLLAQVITAKLVDHLPLYRQEAIYARSGMPIPRSTLAGWVGACGVALQPLVDALRHELLAQPVLHGDETPVALLDPGAGKTKRAYLFAYRSADPAVAPIVLFDFCSSRSGEHAQRMLGDYRGALLVDDYAGYKALFARGISELGCWAHARRKFHELHVAGKSQIAQEALQRIAVLYRIEADAAGFDAEARHAHRQQHAAPHLSTFKQWLDAIRLKVAAGSGTAQAIDYTLKRWAALTRYADDGRYPIDNNPIENAIRPIALGRKNWLFAGSEPAGRRTAALMSLIATAKANGHDVHAWLKDVLTRLPTTLDRDIGTLLPHRWKPRD